MNYINEFHFIRPWFLLLIIPAVILPFLVPFILKKSNAWHRITDSYLVKHLFEKRNINLIGLKILVLMISLSFAISLSGPSFFKVKVKAMKNRIPTIFVMDLSLSMQASDVKPNRIKVAGKVVKRILDEIKGNAVGLVVYTDEPYRIVPITDDTDVISNLLPLLGVRVMPTFGSRPDRALTLAYDMIANYGENAGHIILVADGAGDAEKETISILRDEYYSDVYVSVVGVGTVKGAPVPRLDAGFVKNPDGSLVMTSLDEVSLEKIARFGKGYYLNQNISSSEIKKLIEIINNKILENQSKDSEKSEDLGYWFIVPIVIMLPFFFKKTMLNLVIFGLILMPKPSRAEFKELWFNSNQVGIYYYKKGEYAKAAESFSNKHLKAVALIKAGSFKEALETAKSDGSFDTLYNTGTLLLKEAQYSMAIAPLKQALELEPYNEDAYINYEIAKRLAEDEENQDGEGDNENSQGQGGGENEKDNNDNQNQGNNPENQGNNQGDSDKQDNQNNQQNQNNDDSEQSDQSGQGGSGQGGGSGSGASDGDEGEGKGSGDSGNSGGDDQNEGDDSENGGENNNQNNDNKGQGGSSSGADGQGGEDNNESEGNGSGGSGSGGGENEENNQGDGGSGQQDNQPEQNNDDKKDNQGDQDKQPPDNGGEEKGENNNSSGNSDTDNKDKGNQGDKGEEEQNQNSGNEQKDGKQNPDDKEQSDNSSGNNDEKQDKGSGGEDKKDDANQGGEKDSKDKSGGGKGDKEEQDKSDGKDNNEDSSKSGENSDEKNGGGKDGDGENDGSKSDKKGEDGENKSDEKNEDADSEGADKDKGSKGDDDEKELDESPEVKETKDKLKNIKDDPTILIKNKILRQFHQKRYNGEYEKNPW